MSRVQNAEGISAKFKGFALESDAQRVDHMKTLHPPLHLVAVQFYPNEQEVQHDLLDWLRCS